MRNIKDIFFLLLIFSTALHVPVANCAADPKQEKVLQQKLYLLDNMINRGSAVKHIRAGNNHEAQSELRRAEEFFDLARESLKDKQYPEVAELINKAIRSISSARSMVKGEGGSSAADRNRYRELLKNIESLEQGISLEAKDKLDQDKVSDLKKQAAKETKSDQYTLANKLLDEAYQLISTAIATSIQQTTVVYDLNFSFPQEEYEYELNRYTGNRELVTMMLEQRKDSGTGKLVARYAQQADATKSSAEKMAKQENYGVAISIMEQASKQLKRAMNMLGLRF